MTSNSGVKSEFGNFSNEFPNILSNFGNWECHGHTEDPQGPEPDPATTSTVRNHKPAMPLPSKTSTNTTKPASYLHQPATREFFEDIFEMSLEISLENAKLWQEDFEHLLAQSFLALQNDTDFEKTKFIPLCNDFSHFSVAEPTCIAIPPACPLPPHHATHPACKATQPDCPECLLPRLPFIKMSICNPKNHVKCAVSKNIPTPKTNPMQKSKFCTNIPTSKFSPISKCIFHRNIPTSKTNPPKSTPIFHPQPLAGGTHINHLNIDPK